MAKVTIPVFEQQVFEKEDIRIVVRGLATDLVEEYQYDRATSARTSINKWLETRVRPCIGERDVVVIDGEGSLPNRRTHVTNLRQSYIE